VAYSIRTATPGKRFDVRTTAEQRVVIARCIGQCTLALPLGTYELRLYTDKGEPDGTTGFTVSNPGNLEVRDAKEGDATIGIAMGTGGIVLMLGGTLLLFSSLCISDSIDTKGCPNGSDSRALLGLSALLVGAVITPIGWVLYAHNNEPRTSEKPLLLPFAAATGDHRGGVIGFQGTF